LYQPVSVAWLFALSDTCPVPIVLPTLNETPKSFTPENASSTSVGLSGVQLGTTPLA
jgi:hypothetical protein